ncbi:type II toxin-antitoxin system VapC family toxin [Sphingomonas qilianensis]|uniref:Type II toxin-antitoxin system VapC family toxin n=1 Tax=Sphingomonas qilianensis TaxID=1736690 RepID=A0ABU9XW12_9SPHN
MRLLLDTHALAWWFEDSDRLGDQARAAIEAGANDVLVSAVSVFEMSLKHRSGKWPEMASLLDDLNGYILSERFDVLPLSMAHAQLAGSLPIPHRDPFDRLLIAQAQIEQTTLVSNEALFDQFGVRRLW